MKNDIETSNYIAEMILELRNLAKGARMFTLQGLLEIAYYEAFSTAHAARIPEGESNYIHELGADARKANVA